MSILTDEIRYQLLKRLEQNRSLTQRELAKVLGISLGKTNYCLNSVIKKGWVKAKNFRKSQQKLGYAYFLTPKGLEEKGKLAIRFLKRKIAEHEEIKKQIWELHNEIQQGGLDKSEGELSDVVKGLV